MFPRIFQLNMAFRRNMIQLGDSDVIIGNLVGWNGKKLSNYNNPWEIIQVFACRHLFACEAYTIFKPFVWLAVAKFLNYNPAQQLTLEYANLHGFSVIAVRCHSLIANNVSICWLWPIKLIITDGDSKIHRRVSPPERKQRVKYYYSFQGWVHHLPFKGDHFAWLSW